MPTYEQLPGRLDLAFRSGDFFSTELDFSISLVGYSATATLVSIVNGKAVASFATTINDAAAGKITIAISAAETAAIVRGSYVWHLMWNTGSSASTRTALAGFVEVS